MYLSIREKVKSTFAKYPKVFDALQHLKSVFYVFNYLKYYTLPNSSSSIREINIEFSSACNLRCIFCSLDHLKPSEHMPLSTLKKILTEIRKKKRFKKVERINLYNGGETLLHPKRVEMFKAIAEAKELAKKNKQPFPEVLLLTNGMLLRPKLAQQILETGALDVIQFSFDGGTQQKFEDLRVNAKWPKFYENVKQVHQLRKQLQPQLQLKSITIVEHPHPLDTSWMDPDFVELISFMNHYELRRLHDWGGEVEIGEKKSKAIKKIGCSMLMHQMVVLPNGDVTVCCNDLNAKGVVGNVLETSLEAVYFSTNRKRYLDLLLKGKREQLDLCKNCEVH